MKNIHKIYELIDQLNDIDGHIQEIESLATNVCDNHQQLTLSIQAEKLEGEKEEENESLFKKSDHPYIMEGMWSTLVGSSWGEKYWKAMNTTYTENFQDKAALEILGLLMKFKMHDRSIILKKLEKLGVKPEMNEQNA